MEKLSTSLATIADKLNDLATKRGQAAFDMAGLYYQIWCVEYILLGAFFGIASYVFYRIMKWMYISFDEEEKSISVIPAVFMVGSIVGFAINFFNPHNWIGAFNPHFAIAIAVLDKLR